MADVDGIVDAVPAGVADPLPAGDKLPLGVLPEAIAHAAVAARDAHARADGLGQILHVLVLDFAHRPAGHDQVKPLQHF